MIIKIHIYGKFESKSIRKKLRKGLFFVLFFYKDSLQGSSKHNTNFDFLHFFLFLFLTDKKE